MSYLTRAGGRLATPQSRPIPGSGQVPNSAGGYSWSVDPLTRLRRFLILGAEGGSYYASERELVMENISCLSECDPVEALTLIQDVSVAGRAPKADPALYALAFYAGHEDEKTRKAALEVVFPAVVRTGTHLLHFIEFVEKNRGWGRSLRRAVGKWFVDNPVEAVAYQAIKYRQRDGWSQRDALRLAHPAANVSSRNPTLPVTEEQELLFDWMSRGSKSKVKGKQLPAPVKGFRKVQKPGRTTAEIVELITRYNLPREALPTEALNTRAVWKALLHSGDHGMPMGALVRNLPTMTRLEVLQPMGKETKFVQDRLLDQDAIKYSKIHPLQVLVALLTYSSGKSIRGSSTWEPVREIMEALDKAFYLAFSNVEPIGKRWMLGLDVSGSMNNHMVNGIPGLSPRVASAAMALVTANSGDPYEVVGFTGGDGLMSYDSYTFGTRRGRSDTITMGQPMLGLTRLNISPRRTLVDVCRSTDLLPYGRTDCSLPMLYALKVQREVDGFLIFTDSETWAGGIHPAQALEEYRKQMSIDAKLVVVGMVSNGFSIADPNDPGMLDVVGFDTGAPQIISEFVAGRI